eukprot:m.201948 g.201948  ORF g.201948 m.201948 type:complete len:511 (+) comp21639_c0_seq1:185-1717(+)
MSRWRWGQAKAPANGDEGKPEPDPDPPELTGRQSFNPIGRMFVLSGHSDIVRRLCRLSNTRFASASDDHSIAVWDTLDHRCKAELHGHRMPVTCMMMVRRPGHTGDVLLTGSTDKTIRVWDIDEGTCIDTWQTVGGTVKTMADLRGGLCCSGGHDLCVWTVATGELAARVDWDDTYDTDIREIIAVDNGNYIVAACDDPHLVAYRVKRGGATVATATRGDDNKSGERPGIELAPARKLMGHREPVQCLKKLSEHAFASGSMDGSVCLWDVSTLELVRMLNYHESYELRATAMHTYPYSVNHIASTKGWVVAATGSGFVLFNMATGKAATRQQAAHSAPVSRILLIGSADGRELCVVTASMDATVKLWDVSSCCSSASSAAAAPSLVGSLARKMGGPMSPTKSRVRRDPRLIGHLRGHTGAINDLVAMDGFGFVSCASDRTIISWRNAAVEWQRVNACADAAMAFFCAEDERGDERGEDGQGGDGGVGQEEHGGHDQSSIDERATTPTAGI